MIQTEHVYAEPPTDLIYIRTGYDTIYFRSEVIVKKWRKCRLRGLRVEFIENGLSEDHEILYAYRGQSAAKTCQI